MKVFIFMGLLIFIIAWIIWVSWKTPRRKERSSMNENEVVDKERQSIAKHEKDMKEESAREQANRMEQARVESDRRASEQRAKEEQERQERLRKESEKKKADQNKKYSIAGHGNDLGTDIVRIAETSVKMLYDDTKFIINQTKELLQKRAESKQLTEGECNKIISTYENLKNQVGQLEKVNKNLDTLKDKKVMEKYETSKADLEKKIGETLGIQKDKPKFLQNKNVPENTFREKVQKGLSELGEKAKIATERLKEIRTEKQSTQREHKPASTSRTASQSKTVAPKTRTR